MLRWPKTVVVSDVEKASKRRQVGIGKTSASESLMTCRKPIETASKLEVLIWLQDESGGYPATGQAVPGMEAT